ncbi:MAG: translation initiation factor IF-2 [Bacteroidia bacterium]|nr:translation initiation factor IF-2 [Bacteroidia bacterium]
MPEYRLAKVASELNRSAKDLAEFLNTKGFDVDGKPTAKISEEMHNLLLEVFSADKAAKEEANQLKSLREQKTPPPPVAQVKTPATPPAKEVVTPVVEKPAPTPPPAVVEPPKEEVVPEEKTTEKIEIPTRVDGPKVIGKIDLAEKKPSKDKKSAKPEPKETPKVETPAPPKVEKPVEKTKSPEPPVVEEVLSVQAPELPKIAEPTIDVVEEEDDDVAKHETQFEKLSGPKVLGKIELPKDSPKGLKSLANEAREDLREKRKRKRKNVAAEKVTIQEKVKEDEKQNRDQKPVTTANKPEISQKRVQEKVKSTMGRIGGSGQNRGNKQKLKTQKREKYEKEEAREKKRKEIESRIIKVSEFLTANELAVLMNIPVTQVISACFKLGIMVAINQRLDAQTIEIVADDNGFQVEFVDAEAQLEVADDEIDNPKDLKPRPPIVTVMGHVDHGKTSLLDYIRKENVIAGEAGGITQHIAAYEVTLIDGRKITFLDTPGHEAFTAMRARGAKVTDLAIIVIAADDSVMPQTREAIAHAQAAGVPMVFAINKIDKDGANPDKIREELSGMNILVEDWGGKFQCQEISAKKGLNIDKLLEKVLLEAEMMEILSNPTRRAKGTVIEATQEKGRGIVCSMLVENGTLRVGDHMVAGPYYAKVRALMNERDQRVEMAPPGTPVKMLGFSETPAAGDGFVVMEEESSAKELANKRMQLVREQGIRTKRHITLDEIGRRLAVGNFKELKLIVKGDVDGSVEALSDSLLKLSTEEIAVSVIHSGVGQITESDVLLASASDAIILGFQVRPSAKARQLAEAEDIDIRSYSIIYKAIEEIKMAMEGMLSPEVIEKITGNVEVREVFRISKIGTIAGAYVTDGVVERKSKIRVIRDGVVLHTGTLSSLKRFKDDVKEVTKSYECGLQIHGFNDIEVGDYLEVYKEEEVKRKL